MFHIWENLKYLDQMLLTFFNIFVVTIFLKFLSEKLNTTIFQTKSGGIVDDLIVYRLDDKDYMLVVNASNIKKDWDHIEEK